MNTTHINGRDLRCELQPKGGLGCFEIVSINGPVLTISEPHFRLLKATVDQEDHVEIDDEELLSLDVAHRETLLRMSIKVIRDQASFYRPADYEGLVTESIKYTFERQKLAERFDLDEQYSLKKQIQRGSLMMVNEVKSRIYEITSSLLNAIDDGIENFYDEFIRVLARYSEEWSATFQSTYSLEKFKTSAVKQHEIKEPSLHDSSQVRSYPTGLLVASWFRPVLIAMWRGEFSKIADKSPGVYQTISDMFLDLAREPPQWYADNIGQAPALLAEEAALLAEEAALLAREDRLWLEFRSDFGGGPITAGLSPNVIAQVLEQHDRSIPIDLLKLFTTLWTEHPEVQRSNTFNIPGRWEGLLEMLSERYGLSKNKTNLMNVKQSCRLLESMRYGASWDDHEKLIAFGGRKRNHQLTATYLEGLTRPFKTHERLAPILNHPQGKGRSRPLYTRMGLTLGLLFVDHSKDYYHSGGIGIEMTDEVYDFIKQRAGFRRNSDVDKVLDAFKDHGAIERQDGLIGLGEKNDDGKLLVLEGARRSIKGRQAALLGSASKKSR